MVRIIIRFRNGDEAVFKHQGRPGGSYTKTLRFEGGAAIVKDEWGKEYIYPLDTIKEIIKE